MAVCDKNFQHLVRATTDTQTHTQTDRHTHRHTQTHRHTHTHKTHCADALLCQLSPGTDPPWTYMEHGLQLGDLCSELANHLCIWILVDNGLAHNLLCTVGVSQRGQRLVVVDVGG